MKSNGAAMRVLVIDDHRAFREEVVDMLARNGHAADAVDNAVDAIPLTESGRYDFVLVDFGMPEHSGLWFLRSVKMPSKTKALLVTAFIDAGIIEHMFRAGVCGYLIKPFDEDDLLWNLDFHARRSAAPAAP